MRTFRLKDLQDVKEGHMLDAILPGKYISAGGLAFTKPEERSHTHDGPGGKDYHVHSDCEAFIIIQGTGSMEVDHMLYPVTTGDVIIIEPGEDHHLISSRDNPIVALWCHAGPARHKNQL
jgi:mannose-6-phosphate isomerase-like protein (cupin superfamily)